MEIFDYGQNEVINIPQICGHDFMHAFEIDFGIVVSDTIAEGNHIVKDLRLLRGNDLLPHKNLPGFAVTSGQAPAFVRNEMIGETHTALNGLIQIKTDDVLTIAIFEKIFKRSALVHAHALQMFTNECDFSEDEVGFGHV